MSNRIKRLFQLFLANLYIAAFTFGGGFVITTFMHKKFVEELNWLDDDEMLDLVAIAQTCPGSIAVNAAILTGYHIEGILGVLVSSVATILPPFFIMIMVALFYDFFASNILIATLLEGVLIGVIAIIIDTVINLFSKMSKTASAFHYFMLVVSASLVLILKMNAIKVIFISLLIALMFNIYSLIKKKEIN